MVDELLNLDEEAVLSYCAVDKELAVPPLPLSVLAFGGSVRRGWPYRLGASFRATENRSSLSSSKLDLGGGCGLSSIGRSALAPSRDLPWLFGRAKTRKDAVESRLLLCSLWTSSSTFPEDLRRGNPLRNFPGIEQVCLFGCQVLVYRGD